MKEILRYVFIEGWQSEPHYQHKKLSERRYQDIKRIANTSMDPSGTTPSLWLFALKYTAFLLIHTSYASLNKAIPLTVSSGVTQHISILLQFSCYERLYICEDETSFPSQSREFFGRFVGFVENVEHALTLQFLLMIQTK